jgi:hypothetical protein
MFSAFTNLALNQLAEKVTKAVPHAIDRRRMERVQQVREEVRQRLRDWQELNEETLETEPMTLFGLDESGDVPARRSIIVNEYGQAYFVDPFGNFTESCAELQPISPLRWMTHILESVDVCFNEAPKFLRRLLRRANKAISLLRRIEQGGEARQRIAFRERIWFLLHGAHPPRVSGLISVLIHRPGVCPT